jgi:hypothetical protein
MTSRARWALVLAVVLASCGDAPGGDPPDTAGPGDSTTIPAETTIPAGDPEPDQPQNGIGLIVDWSDPSRVLELDEGWTIQACEGDAPLLCVEEEGVHAGLVEGLAYPIESYPDLDPTADTDTNLGAVARGFLESLRSDRSDGCGADYDFQPIEPEPFVLANTPGMVYGFVGTTSSGDPSELILQYATIVGDQIVLIVAAAYDEGGCPGRDELGAFESEALFRFRPYLEMVLHESPLPDLDT